MLAEHSDFPWLLWMPGSTRSMDPGRLARSVYDPCGSLFGG